MGNNSVPKFIFRLSRFPVYRGSVLGRVYCINIFQYINQQCGNKKKIISNSVCEELGATQINRAQRVAPRKKGGGLMNTALQYNMTNQGPYLHA